MFTSHCHLMPYYLTNILDRLSARDKPTNAFNMSAQRYGRGNQKCWGGPWGLPDTNSTQYFLRANKRIFHWDTSNNQIKRGICCIQTQREVQLPPGTDSGCKGLHVRNRPCIRTPAQPRRLIAYYENRTIENAWGGEILEESSDFILVHWHEQSNQERGHHAVVFFSCHGSSINWQGLDKWKSCR